MQSYDENQSNLIDLQPSQAQMQATIQMEEEVDLSELQEREQSIRKIETDIVEVNQIFKDLATMVHEQGEVIDSIEANVETASIQVTEGAQQISKARDYQVCFGCNFNKFKIFCPNISRLKHVARLSF